MLRNLNKQKTVTYSIIHLNFKSQVVLNKKNLYLQIKEALKAL